MSEPSAVTRPENSLTEEIREFWDADAPTYDLAPAHRPTSAAVMAAWTATLSRWLPPKPARVLDVGAGTGFLSLIAARLGYTVTALDISSEMLGTLKRSAELEDLGIETMEGRADEVPSGFDAVMERHLLWTLPDPLRALGAWRGAAPEGRLVVFESIWGKVDPVESIRARARHEIRKIRGARPEHHGEYPAGVRETLPFGFGTPPAKLVDAVSESGWRSPRLERLRDIEWAERLELSPLERLAGVPPRFLIVAD